MYHVMSRGNRHAEIFLDDVDRHNFLKTLAEAGQKTGMFMKEIKDMGLLMDGEVAIQQEGIEQPFIYRGFKMVNQEKLREVRGDRLLVVLGLGELEDRLARVERVHRLMQHLARPHLLQSSVSVMTIPLP